MGGEGRCAYEFANDALVDEDGDGEAEEADDGEAAARPAEVELEVLAAGVPLLDPPVLVHLHPATHLLLLLPSSARRRRVASPMLRRRIWWCEGDRMQGTTPRASLLGFLQIDPGVLRYLLPSLSKPL